MKDQILELLARENRPMRLRDIGRSLGVWHCSLAGIMGELEDSGEVITSVYSDPANMEYYKLFSLKD